MAVNSGQSAGDSSMSAPITNALGDPGIVVVYAPVAQLAEATVSKSVQCPFESDRGYQ
ncbi:MAG: hypothetical protein JWQ81_5898 [Amycolatopsis sp.]|nr:hypothetical protein [Amycolatopsis sp.]